MFLTAKGEFMVRIYSGTHLVAYTLFLYYPGG